MYIDNIKTILKYLNNGYEIYISIYETEIFLIKNGKRTNKFLFKSDFERLKYYNYISLRNKDYFTKYYTITKKGRNYFLNQSPLQSHYLLRRKDERKIKNKLFIIKQIYKKLWNKITKKL